MMQITLRPWSIPADAVRIAEIQSANWWGVTAADVEQGYTTFPPDGVSHRRVAVDETGRVVGFGSAWRLPHDEPGRFQIRVMVDSACRRQGVGSRLLAEVEGLARSTGASLFESRFRDDEGMLPFAEHHNYVMGGHHTPYKLDVAAFDAGRFAGLMAKVAAQGIRFVSMAEPHETALEEAVYELEKAASRDEPGFEDDPFPPFAVWRKESMEDPDHPGQYFIVALHGDQPVAMTAWHRAGGRLWARFTCVHREYRGRGLSTAVKVPLILAARRDGIDFLFTGSDVRNTAMITANRGLGYVPDQGGMYRCFKRV